MDALLEQLVRLQEADTRIARLLEAIFALPKRLAFVDQQLQKQRSALEQAQKAAAAEETKRRRMESDLKECQYKIAKYREQSSSVKTNEQFHALQHEISFVEADIRRIEDEELASMIRSEALDRNLREAKEEAARQARLLEQEKEKARVESSAEEHEVEALRRERSALRAAIDPETLARYDRLTSSSRKTALARASGQRCLACQMALRPQYWNQVRAGTLLNCESCGRLLYFDSRVEPVSQAASGPVTA
jgi:uncharacterized protein